MKRWGWSCLVAILLQLICVSPAHAVIIEWDWQFEPDGYTAGRSETVSIFARIFNLGLPADPNLTLADFSSISGVGAGAISHDAPIPIVYDSDPSHNVFTELAGLNLAPGENVLFTMDRLVPKGGHVPDGTYGGEGNIVGPDRNAGFGSPSLTRNVSVTVTPEPGSLMLFGLGLAGFGLRNRRRKSPTGIAHEIG